MSNSKIVISAFSSLSALGSEKSKIWEGYRTRKSLPKAFSREIALPVFRISDDDEKLLAALAEEQSLRFIDRVGLNAIFLARTLRKEIVKASQFPTKIGVCIGSARGATSNQETHHKRFLESGKVGAHTSPTTTAGSVASFVAQDLGIEGPALSVSMTCTSSLQALSVGYFFIKSGYIDAFIVGGVESPLTEFTLAQMKSLGIYREDIPVDSNPESEGLILGEGGALFLIETEKNALESGRIPIAEILGVGLAQEIQKSSTSISDGGDALYNAMQEALTKSDVTQRDVDVVVTHTPGTPKGDLAERAAIARLFSSKHPTTISNKYLIGHTFGASGALNLELGIYLLQGLKVPGFEAEKVRNVLVNAAGFGGVADSILLSAY